MKTLSNMSARLHAMALAKRQKGATMIEYVLLAALIGVVIAAFIPPVTSQIKLSFDAIKTAVTP